MADWIANGEAANSIRAKLNMTSVSAATDIADTDYVQYYDTSATTMKKSLWSNIKSVLKTYFDALYCPILVVSYGTNGYAKIGTFYIQWGTNSVKTSSTVTLPITFPTAGLFGIAGLGTFANVTAICSAISTTQITLTYYSGSGSPTVDINWIAIGH